ncbi:MAG: 3-oxo-tetronate 4-phosphate decarboxylase [Paracidovorax wautersii]|uniref:3-oxo-tetronate 4-phosphate decarboxylase n=1 Tax=Paracidovorax wautersii TaxID=1177982 RepID=A0A7V8FQI0_9BURK|nr:MAG: 3-oxo-tetronate 4-phosphate decarboxylase [Paracidovorax wautersii]
MTTATPYLSEAEARAEICRVGRELFARGYVHATAGNISVKLAQGFLITPTDACLGNLAPERLALLDDQGQQLSGDRASKTIVLHRRIYEASAATPTPARCVIHTHSTHLVACSLQGGSVDELLPALTPYFVMKVGRVPHIPYHRPGAPAAAEAVAQAIAAYAQAGRPIRAIMLARLGPNVWHDTPAAAMATLEELEETARLWTLVQPAPLTEPQIDELRQTFGAHW